MRKIRLATAFLITGLTFVLGCDGCFDDDLVENQVQSPEFSLVRGTNYTVEMASSTEGASIKYTIDGTDPKESGTAVDGNSAAIDYFTEIRAYAYRDGMTASEVTCYKLPTFDRTVKVNYKSDMYVDTYSYSELDGNENKKIEVFLNGKGSDSVWFTGDDVIYEYHLFLYDETGLTRENVYTGNGGDGEWLTDDDVLGSYYLYVYNAGVLEKKELYNSADVLQNYWAYEYSGSNVSHIKKYTPAVDELSEDTLLEDLQYNYAENLTSIYNLNPTDQTITSYVSYTYLSDGKTDTESEVIPGATTDEDVTVSFSKYQYNDIIKEYSKFSYNGDIVTETKYHGYGADTDFAIIEYAYNGTKLVSKTEYDGINKAKYKLFTEYSYNVDDTLNTEICYTSPSKDEKLYSYQYDYTDGKLVQKNKIDSDDSTLLEYVAYEYDGNNKIKETLFIQPDPGSFKITFNLSVAAGVVDGGYYSSSGVNYTYEGVPASSIVNTGVGQAEVVQKIINQIKNIYENTEVTNNGIVIAGTVSGKILITARVVDTTITINYDFQSYNNGDVTIDGVVTKVLTGTLDQGSLSGELSGSMTGSLTITDSDPQWSNDQYAENAITTFEYESGLLKYERFFVDAGEDGDWATAGNNQQYVKEYIYDAANGNRLQEIKFSTDAVSPTKCAVEEEITDYRLLYVYDESGQKIQVDKVGDYGTYVKTYSGAGDDGVWEQVDDNIFLKSSLEFTEE